MINKNRNCTVREVKERPAFQVGGRLFKTKLAAAKSMAWGWILSKYDTSFTGGKKIEDIQKVLDYECDCNNYYGCDDCLLHNRKEGYFRRLQKKCTTYILRSWGES